MITSSTKFHNVLKIRPPLVFSAADDDDFVGAFDECMGEIGEMGE
jgi:4-aminobutyrate aminotransferase-like enzyme